MSDKEIPIVSLQDFLSGPQHTNTPKQLGKQWHAVLEAVLFAASSPLTLDDLRNIVEDLPKGTIHQLLIEIQKSWQESKRGIQLVEVATGWQFRTHPDTASYVRKLDHIKPKKLSKAAMEALAVVAYRQPVTRSEVEQIRGVAFGSNTIEILMELDWVRPSGRKDVLGKPIQYTTTENFLNHFNIQKLSDLPTIDELGTAGLIDTTSIDKSIFGTGKFFKEQSINEMS